MVLVAACGESSVEDPTTTLATTTTTAAAAAATQTGTAQAGMTAGALRDRHQAPIPADYSGLTNPVAADEESLARGLRSTSPARSVTARPGSVTVPPVPPSIRLR